MLIPEVEVPSAVVPHAGIFAGGRVTGIPTATRCYPCLSNDCIFNYIEKMEQSIRFYIVSAGTAAVGR